jgi:hypothetical protein
VQRQHLDARRLAQVRGDAVDLGDAGQEAE